MERFSYEETHAPIGRMLDVAEESGILARLNEKAIYFVHYQLGSGTVETEVPLTTISTFRVLDSKSRFGGATLSVDNLSESWNGRIGAFALASKVEVYNNSFDDNDYDYNNIGNMSFPDPIGYRWEYQLKFAPVVNTKDSGRVISANFHQAIANIDFDILLPIQPFPYELIMGRSPQNALKESIQEAEPEQIEAWLTLSQDMSVPIQSRITISSELAQLRKQFNSNTKVGEIFARFFSKQ